ncbi:hypothetical protein BB561_000603 [Smittium simulii]|uniref:Uncharacterized protein n=1 Tax=Smittium simulii TaxID=133385 RepID=A0A2T9YYG0_9FUNG|nr:hypothetical protein BB561_000603 [Smittium simulii]
MFRTGRFACYDDGFEPSNSAVVNDVQVKSLNWFDDSVQNFEPSKYDIILGSDLVYDPEITPYLVKTLVSLIVTNNQIAYIASTRRRHETFNEFITLIGKSFPPIILSVNLNFKNFIL